MQLPTRMRVAVATRYGPPDVVRIEERAVPAVRAREILIKTATAAVTAGDWRLRSLDLPAGFKTPFRLFMGWNGLRQPVLGVVSAGEVVAVGDRVSAFQVGDRVVCLNGMVTRGHAEYRAVPEGAGVSKIPGSMSFADATAIPFGGTTALYFLRNKARVQPGERVCVVGASGEVGAMAVQLAKHYGAHVTAVCSGANADLVRSIGADDVVDYTAANYWDAGEPVFDVVFDAVGASSYADAAPVLREGGRFIICAGGLYELMFSSFMGRRGHTCVSGTPPESAADIALLCQLAEQGEIRPVVDQVLPFDRIVDAYARVDSRRKRGTLILEFGDTADGGGAAAGAASGAAAQPTEGQRHE